MTVVTTTKAAAVVPCKKLMKFGASIFRRGFNSSKCKTMAKLATARIKLLRNKREVVVKQMRRDVALLLQSGQDATARIRVEHVIREQNIMAANEIVELFCELVVVRLPIIAKQRECPADLKEGISSLIFAAPRCSDIPELLHIRDIFEKKYGKEFVSAATDLRPDCGVNRTLIEKLSVKTPTGEVKLKVMKEIAKEHQIVWDTAESEKELLKPPEELIEGPRTFVSAASMPVKSQNVKPNGPSNRSMDVGEPNVIRFKDTASAAQAAAESAKKAIAAAQAAAHLANMNSHQVTEQINMENWSSNRDVLESQTGDHSVPRDPPVVSQNRSHQSSLPGRLNESSYLSDEEEEEGGSANLVDGRKFHRRHSHNVPPEHSDIKFDDSDGLDSDCNEEIDMEMPSGGINPPPPNRSPPPIPTAHAYQPDDRTTKFASCKQDSVPHLHPKLPDYDALAARFEALKNRKS